MNTLPKILVILGPTASGKSAFAVETAKKFNGEIISADSRQVYTGLDIGTGKITKKEMKGIPHHLLDVVNPKKQFSVAQYKKLGEKAIKEILKKGKLPIICGGTGLYIDTLLGNISLPEVEPNPKLRKELETKTTEQLFKILQKLNPARAKSIDAKNPRRLIRAIEIAKTLGKVPHFAEAPQGKYDVLKIGINIPDEELKQKINKRLVERIKKGMITEAKKLHEGGLSYARMHALGLEYGRLADFLEKKISKEELTSLLETEIWQYAKRQKTWFKRDKKIIWISPSKSASSLSSLQKLLIS